MGACASRHEVLKNAGEAPMPAPENNEAEVVNEEATFTAKKEEALPSVVAEEGGEANLPPLEMKNEKSSYENTPEQVKEDNIKLQESMEVVEKSTKIEAPETTKEEVAKTEEAPKIENKNVTYEIERPPQTEKEVAETVEEKPVEETPKPVEETPKPVEETTKSGTSPDKPEEEKSQTDTIEAKTIEEKKTAGSDDKKPLFKLWF